MLKVLVKANAYYDSITLMLISQKIEKEEGIENVLVGMGTDTNKSLLKDLNMVTPQTEEATVNDLIIAIKGESESIENSLKNIDGQLNSTTKSSDLKSQPYSIESALQFQPDSNMTVISTAGEYAGIEAKKSLEKNMHVMLFSDNVSLEKEIELKKYALEKNLLVMGPDCGTAIINGIGLGFANSVTKGNIGIVGASGTGSQEVSSIISNLKGGISQLIGTGGRDVKEQVGGIMFLKALKHLIDDKQTEIIVLVSKPPAQSVIDKTLELLNNTDKPAVIHFINGNAQGDNKKIFVGKSLEDTAVKAILLSQNKLEEINSYDFFKISKENFDYEDALKKELEKCKKTGKYIRGLFSGGTLADEALILLSEYFDEIWSNTPIDPKYKIENSQKSYKNTIIDMGEDEFTQGRPHPMIDFNLRKERLIEEYKNPEVALIHIDVVLGYGAHMNPAGEIVQTLEKLGNEPHTCIVASLVGTYTDYQGYEEQKKILSDAGILVFPTNASALKFVKLFVEKNLALSN